MSETQASRASGSEVILKIPEEGLELQVRKGEAIQEICDRQMTGILFGCFSARCGICRIRVLENPSGLSEMDDMERELLELLSAGPDERLACQCRVTGDVSIAPVRQI